MHHLLSSWSHADFCACSHATTSGKHDPKSNAHHSNGSASDSSVTVSSQSECEFSLAEFSLSAMAKEAVEGLKEWGSLVVLALSRPFQIC